MPTYEYECLNCGAHFDIFQKMSDAHLEKCIECQGRVRRIVSGGSGLIFKGSGFYETDYVKGKNGSPKPKEKISAKKTNAPAKNSSTKSVKETSSKK